MFENQCFAKNRLELLKMNYLIGSYTIKKVYNMGAFWGLKVFSRSSKDASFKGFFTSENS